MGKLSSKKRMLTAIKLGEPDRIPLAPYVGSWYAPKLCGVQISEFTLGNNQKRAKILLEAQQKYGYDWIIAGGGHPYNWERTVKITEEGDSYRVTNKDNGTTTIYPKDDVPHTPLGKYTFEEIEKMEVRDSQDILRSGVLEPVEIISKKVGKEVLVESGVTGPWASSRTRIGFVEWIKAAYRSPELAKKTMRILFDANLEYAKAAVEAGAEAVFVEEGSVAADTIPPKLYEKLPFPYECEFIKELKKLGVSVILSLTGDIMPILDKIIETNADGYHFEESKKGFIIDVFQIRERLEGKKCFFIPFDQINLLRSGTLDEVRKGVIEIIQKSASGGGVVLSTGSPVLRDTPVENFEMMIQTAKTAGMYPIKL